MTSGTQEVIGWNGLRQRIDRSAALQHRSSRRQPSYRQATSNENRQLRRRYAVWPPARHTGQYCTTGPRHRPPRVPPQHQFAMRQDQTSGKRVALSQGSPGVATQRAAEQMLRTGRTERPVDRALHHRRRSRCRRAVRRSRPEARRLGAYLITRTMERRPEIGFASYDRLFPSQDTMPAGGFGNLIALPLQWSARAQGNSVFVDRDLRPYEDQWAFLSSIKPIDPASVTARVLNLEAGGLFGGIRLPVEDEDADEPWRMPPSRIRQPSPVTGPLPTTLRMVLADQSYVDRTDLPPTMVVRLARIGSVPEPGILPCPGDAPVNLRQAESHILRRTPSTARGIAARMP